MTNHKRFHFLPFLDITMGNSIMDTTDIMDTMATMGTIVIMDITAAGSQQLTFFQGLCSKRYSFTQQIVIKLYEKGPWRKKNPVKDSTRTM